MDIVFLLLPASIILAGIALFAFLWSAKSGQFEDLETPAHRILHEEDGTLLKDPKDKK